MGMRLDTLFTDKSESTEPEQYDVDSLLNLLTVYVEKRINLQYVGICADRLEDIVVAAHRELGRIDRPGPFKKAAVLTACWMEHTPFFHLLDDIGCQVALVEWDSRLAALSAIEITRLYLKATWPEASGATFTPPSLVSSHFRDDFISAVFNRQNIDIRLLTLVWELMTYMANTEPPIHGAFDKPVALPSLKD